MDGASNGTMSRSTYGQMAPFYNKQSLQCGDEQRFGSSQHWLWQNGAVQQNGPENCTSCHRTLKVACQLGRVLYLTNVWS